MNTCVVYFSKVGNTKIVAEYLAAKIEATAIQLEDDTKYKGLIGFIKGGMGASKKATANLDQSVYDEISKFDRVILATPIWAGKTTPAINAVLENVDFTDKEVYVVTTQADPKLKGSEERKQFYKEIIENKKGKFIEYYPLAGTAPGAKVRSKEDLTGQVDASVHIEK